MKIGFLGFGEAASCIAGGLAEEGAEELAAYDILLNVPEKKEMCLKRMEECHVKPAYSPREAVEGSAVVIVAVPSNYAVETVGEAVDFLEKDCVYVDVSTAAPYEKKEIAKRAEDKGAKFVDGAMLGPLLQYRHKVPMLLSGSGSGAFAERMEPYHMNLTEVQGSAGTATSIKFIRSIAAKGIACILFEALQAAQHFGVEDMIVDSLCESYGAAFEKVIDGYVSGTVIHAARREHEMQNVVDMLRGADLPCEMTEVTRQKLDGIARLDLPARFTNGVPRSWRGVLKEWGLNEAKEDIEEADTK